MISSPIAPRQNPPKSASSLSSAVKCRAWVSAGGAPEPGLTGYAENLDDGRVKVVAEGTAASCARLVDVLRGDDTAGRVDEVLVEWEEPNGSFRGFGIR